MRAAFFQPWPSLYRPGFRRTAIMGLVWALHVLLLLMLLRLAPPPAPPPAAPPVPIMIELMPEAPVARAAPARRKQGRAAKAVATPAAPVPPATPVETTSSSIWSQVIPMTREQFAASDIAAMPSRSMARAGDGTDASGSDDTEGPGEGPDGQPLYNAQWYRKPTHAELNFYMPPGATQTGWGMIACQTVPDNRVENCREIAQSPGSGLASAVRQAAWQFRVRPPRIGGRPMIGAWVRIRIDYTVSGPKG